jgi:hypothetical protein
MQSVEKPEEECKNIGHRLVLSVAVHTRQTEARGFKAQAYGDSEELRTRYDSEGIRSKLGWWPMARYQYTGAYQDSGCAQKEPQ